MWKDLPIVIRRRVRQRGGHGLPSSRLTARGFDIKAVRDFQAGDTIRAVSRRHYARTGEEIVIERHPERGAHVVCLVDVSASGFAGSDRIKYAAMLEFLRHFGDACVLRDYTVQFIAFAVRIEFESRIISTSGGLEEAIETLSRFKQGFPGTGHREVLDLASSMAVRLKFPADLVVIVSDFLFPVPRRDFMRELGVLRDLTDVVAVIMRDRIEAEMPPLNGAVLMRDAETGDMLWAGDASGHDPSRELARCHIDSCVLMTSQTADEWFTALSDFFAGREERW